MITTQPRAGFGHTDEDYARLGLKRGEVEKWEDGSRTHGGDGVYEWWYFDAHLDNGAVVAGAFMTKDLVDSTGPLHPTVRIDLDMPDGRRFNELAHFKPEEFSSSTEQCDVRIAGNRWVGDLQTYRITAQVDEVEIDVTMEALTPSWRPETGFALFGEAREDYFAWMPAVPRGKVTATYRVGDESATSQGTGYHDRNWGNIAMEKVINNWYWARGDAGPYSVVASLLVATEDYDHTTLPIFRLAKHDVVIADKSENVSFEALGRFIDHKTGKAIDNVTRYTYEEDETRYVVTFTRHKDLVLDPLVDSLPPIKRAIAKLARVEGAYLRFLGEIRISHYENDTLVDEHTNEVVHEQMYLGGDHELA